MVDERTPSIAEQAKYNNIPGEHSLQLREVKEKLGLPTWNDISDELKSLSKKHGATWAEEVGARIDIYKKYVEYQVLLTQQFTSAGLPQVNAIHNLTDLQVKLFELEEKIREEGKNPLEVPEWVEARKLLMKELQFVHKHKLDIDQFKHNLERAKQRTDDDDVFVVEASVE